MPTIGNTAVTGLTDYYATTQSICLPITPTQNGMLQSISLFHPNDTNYLGTGVQLALYANNPGAGPGGIDIPGTKLAVTTTGNQAQNSWLTLALTTPHIILAGTKYWLVAAAAATFEIQFTYSTGLVYTNVGLPFLSPLGGSPAASTEMISIYGTYTLLGGVLRVASDGDGDGGSDGESISSVLKCN